MQKLTHQLAGELGETLALAKFVSVGLHAYASPPGAPGHDIMVVTLDGPKSIEVKTRQYIERSSEISRWPVNMSTKAEADYFLFVELGLRTLEPTFYLLNSFQAKATYKDYNGNGNCLPNKVRATVAANDFSALTGELTEAISTQGPEFHPLRAQIKPKRAMSHLRGAIVQEAKLNSSKIVQYTSQSIEVFVDDVPQKNTIESLRGVAKKIGVSELNNSGGKRNTRQLGKAVINAINDYAFLPKR